MGRAVKKLCVRNKQYGGGFATAKILSGKNLLGYLELCSCALVPKAALKQLPNNYSKLASVTTTARNTVAM